mmetsp:Transcript_8153/g.19702  ORF Transcript_8153/g.19702 Transcript_8153/m.19702 type:complete len:230 (-) Transcript_8153:3238-3927(-)
MPTTFFPPSFFFFFPLSTPLPLSFSISLPFGLRGLFFFRLSSSGSASMSIPSRCARPLISPSDDTSFRTVVAYTSFFSSSILSSCHAFRFCCISRTRTSFSRRRFSMPAFCCSTRSRTSTTSSWKGLGNARYRSSIPLQICSARTICSSHISLTSLSSRSACSRRLISVSSDFLARLRSIAHCSSVSLARFRCSSFSVTITSIALFPSSIVTVFCSANFAKATFSGSIF